MHFAVVCSTLLAAISAQTQPAAERLVRGRLVDQEGKPIAGAAVGLVRSSEFVATASLLATPPATTAADGTFRVPADGQRRRLLVAARGAQAGEIHVFAAAEGGHDVGDIVLPPGASLVGRVRDGDGKPLAGVRLRVESSLPRGPWGQQPMQLAAAALSNEQGIFTVPCVPRTGLRLVAEAAGCLAVSRLVAQESPIDLVLTRIGVVRGRVVDAAGNPVGGASVSCLSPVADPRGYVGVVTTADGAFVLDVPARGRYRVRADVGNPRPQSFTSGILHGAADDVVVAPVDAANSGVRSLVVRAVDAATKAPLATFTLGTVGTDVSNAQTALFHGVDDRREYDGSAVVSLPDPGSVRGLYVVAPGHGFELVPVPDAGAEFVVELGPEAVLRGRVLDAGTGKPMAGVAVRALPKGQSSGGGGAVKDAGPLSDANGEYVVRGLKPGDYGVQAHAEGRTASAVAAVTLTAATETTLALTVPEAMFVTVELRGTVPPGPAPRLCFSGSVQHAGGGVGFFQHSVVDPAPVPMRDPGTFRLGPLVAGRRELQLLVPSRTRFGAGTKVRLGDVDTGASTTLAVPDLTTVIVKGRVELPGELPSERVAVLATRRNEGDGRWSHWGNGIAATGVDGGGHFTIDVPQGAYVLQLADLLTGIVFHTEAEEFITGEAAVVLKPDLHWLMVELAPASAGAEVLLRSFEVALAPPRDGVRAFLESWGGSDRQHGSVRVYDGVLGARWLVPAGSMTIKAMQAFDTLRPGAAGWSEQAVAEANVDVDGAEQRVQLVVPAPPSDAELLRSK